MFPKYVLLSICAFIRVHFWRPGKIHSVHPSGVHTHFSKTSYDQWIFLKEKLEVISFQKHVGFPARQLIFFFFFLSFFLLALFFPYLLSSLLTCSFFLFFYFYFLFLVVFFFVCFIIIIIFLDGVPKRRTLHGSRISNIIDSNDINTNTTIQTKMYALYKWQSKQQKQTLVSQVKT